jgi:hypothetical protein
MEGIPFRLAITLMVIAIMAGVAFYQVSAFNQFNAKKRYADDVISVNQAMKTLTSVGDKGSFTKVKIRVPEGNNITFDNATDRMTVWFFGEEKTYEVPGDVLWTRYYGPGEYDLQLYYGQPPFDETRDNFTVAFK